MSMTDPIADMLTRIRNANAIRRRQTVDIPLEQDQGGRGRRLEAQRFRQRLPGPGR